MIVNSEAGITLTEILTTIAITAIIGTLLVSIFSQNNRLFYNQQAKVSNGISSNEVINQIDDGIRGAVSIEAQYPAQDPSHITNTSTLILKLASIDSNGNVVPEAFDYLVFTADTNLATILRQILYPSAQSSRQSVNKVISTTLKSITFTYLNDIKVTVSPPNATLIGYHLILSSSQGNSTVESSASGQIRLRNN